MDNWEYMNDSDIHKLPFLAGMSPSVPFPHSNSSTATEDLLDKWNDPVLSKSNVSLLLSTSRPPQTLDVIGGDTGSFDLHFPDEFAFPEDFLAPENIAQPLTELNYFGGHSTKEREHLVSNTVCELSDCDSALLAFDGNETSLLPAPQSHLSPGSKENFYEDIPGCVSRPSGSLSEPFSNSFMPTLRLSEPVSSVKRHSKIITHKRFSEPSYSAFEESGFNSRQNGQQFIEPTVMIRKVLKNSRSCRNIATKSLIKSVDVDQKDVIHQTLNKKHDFRKDPGASKASLAKALGDHLYTLSSRSKSLPELPTEAEVSVVGLKSGSPSFLEAFLLCPSKLNANLGSDELLNSEEVLKSVPEIRSVIQEEKQWLASWNEQTVKMQGSQTDDSISYKNADTLDTSVNSCEFVSDNFRVMDTGEDNVFPADVANLELHKPLLGVDTLLDNDFALDIEWTHFDSHGSNPKNFGGRLTENDTMIEHSDWFQEEQRQEDEYWKSYLNVV